MNRNELLQKIKEAQAALDGASRALVAWDDTPENNVFDTMAEAETAIENALWKRARNDCEGADNCGQDSYSRGFVVDGKEYLGTLTVEYDRHDKTYYYIENSKFNITEAS